MIVISDLHWRTSTPSWRAEENYSRDVLRPQLAEVFKLGEKVVVCGDVFHEARDMAAAYDLLDFLVEVDGVLYCVRGQHDIPFHNMSRADTSYNILEKAGRIVTLGSHVIPNYNVVGMSWNNGIPLARQDNAILIAHVSIHAGVKDDVKGFSPAGEFLNEAICAGFRKVFTGDNHRRFIVHDANWYHLYNAGCFHQMTADLQDQPPAGWLVDHEGNVTLWEIPCKPPVVNTVYSISAEKEKILAAGKEFVDALQQAQGESGTSVFMAELQKSADNSVGNVKALLKELVQLCEK